MKLQQGQVWKSGGEYLRIVHLERLEVKYKAMKDLASREGTHHHVTKKQFCRLLKNATLLSSGQIEKASKSGPRGGTPRSGKGERMVLAKERGIDAASR